MIERFMQIFICGWWLCPELYLQRPFHTHASSRLDNLLEEKAKQGVQVTSIVKSVSHPLYNAFTEKAVVLKVVEFKF